MLRSMHWNTARKQNRRIKGRSLPSQQATDNRQELQTANQPVFRDFVISRKGNGGLEAKGLEGVKVRRGEGLWMWHHLVLAGV